MVKLFTVYRSAVTFVEMNQDQIFPSKGHPFDDKQALKFFFLHEDAEGAPLCKYETGSIACNSLE